MNWAVNCNDRNIQSNNLEPSNIRDVDMKPIARYFYNFLTYIDDKSIFEKAPGRAADNLSAARTIKE